MCFITRGVQWSPPGLFSTLSWRLNFRFSFLCARNCKKLRVSVQINHSSAISSSLGICAGLCAPVSFSVTFGNLSLALNGLEKPRITQICFVDKYSEWCILIIQCHRKLVKYLKQRIRSPSKTEIHTWHI